MRSYGQEDGIRHQGENDAVCSTKTQEKAHLQATASDGNASVPVQEVCQHLGDDSQGVAGLREGECTEEEVHRGVERSVHPRQSHDGQVARTSEKIEAEEGHKEEGLYMWVSGEAYEDEFLQDCLVDCHFFGC